MHPARRAVTAAASLVLAAIAFTGCGVDAGDQATSDRSGSSPTTTAPSEDLTPMEEAAVERAKDLYVEMGMDPDDAECLARGLVDAGATDGTIDLSDAGAMMDIVNQCDIDMGDLNSFSSDNGITSLEDGMEFGMRSSLEASGLTEEEAACVASAYVDEFGTDVSAMQDPAKLRPLLEGCDVDPSSFGN